LVMGDWVLGIGHNPQSPIPNPQSPIPNKNDDLFKNMKFNKNLNIIIEKIVIIIK